MQPVELIGVPIDLGAGRRGVDMGPSALRIAGLAGALEALGYVVVDGGNVEVPQREILDEGEPDLRFLGPINTVCRSLYAATLAALKAGRIPLTLGGDHSVAMGSVAAVADHARSEGGRVGVIWLDAHGDMNSPATTPSGNIHGMPLGCLLGDGAESLVNIASRVPAVDPEDVSLIGIRAIDPPEADVIRASRVNVFTMRELDARGVQAVMEEAVERLVPRCDRLHVSFDVDFLDPGIAPGVGTRVRGGPNYREAHLVMEILADTGLLCSADVVELNPILDRENTSGQLATELLASLFGKRIL
ncbi:MAG: arginase [Deltaproteobacteria bacterium]|nr:arginase [Deltaproteobacteria bacterium]